MSDIQPVDKEFLQKVTSAIEEKLSEESFGVSELAEELGMSRSNLLRKIKNQTNLSASLFIRKVRLEKAMEYLLEGDSNVSEVSYSVGFSSPSYFIKCFHEHFGYPPGEAGVRKRNLDYKVKKRTKWKQRTIIIASIIGLLAVLSSFLMLFHPFSKKNELEKSIAVLPFINDSDDSTNIYIINGLMESILLNLQMIEDLRVVSRTSVEQYRSNRKSIKEIAKELNVSYVVEGSGQKIGNQILLNIQLIEAKSDKHLLSEQYKREDKDIFDLQADVSENVAGKIKAIITPVEEFRINKKPTENLAAYDEFMKGWNLMFKSNIEDLNKAIHYFRNAISLDENFAMAYADLSISYSFLDYYKIEKEYLDSSKYYSDRAIFLDSDLAQSLISKAMYNMNSGNYDEALPYFEKALEYNPNSAFVINALSDYYVSYRPNTEKYLEYALRGIGLDIASRDSAEKSVTYLHLSNAFIQSGFIDEALDFIDMSIEFDPDNIYSEYVKAFILYARDADLEQTKSLLLSTLKRDTTRLDVLQEVGKVCYYLRDYELAYRFYKPFVDAREAYDLNIFRSEDAKIGFVFDKVGNTEESNSLLKDYFDYTEYDKSIYRNLSKSIYYSYLGDLENSIKYMQLFSKEDNYHYWTLLFLKIDPLIDKVKDNAKYKELLEQIDDKFWLHHKGISKKLKKQGLI